jgi:hypothetical protein
MSHFFLKKFCLGLVIATGLLSASCSRQQVLLLEPKENDLVMLNGCVVSACNYLAITKAKHELEKNFWAKVLLVRYENHPAGHAYCVWETEGTIYGYDRNSGGFPIPTYTRDPKQIASVLAVELSKVLKEDLKVKSAEFVEPSKAELYAYAIGSETSAAPAAPPALLGTAPLAPLANPAKPEAQP